MIIQSTALYEPTKYNAILHYALMASKVYTIFLPLSIFLYIHIYLRISVKLFHSDIKEVICR